MAGGGCQPRSDAFPPSRWSLYRSPSMEGSLNYGVPSCNTITTCSLQCTKDSVHPRGTDLINPVPCLLCHSSQGSPDFGNADPERLSNETAYFGLVVPELESLALTSELFHSCGVTYCIVLLLQLAWVACMHVSPPGHDPLSLLAHVRPLPIVNLASAMAESTLVHSSKLASKETIRLWAFLQLKS